MTTKKDAILQLGGMLFTHNPGHWGRNDSCLQSMWEKADLAVASFEKKYGPFPDDVETQAGGTHSKGGQ